MWSEETKRSLMWTIRMAKCYGNVNVLEDEEAGLQTWYLAIDGGYMKVIFECHLNYRVPILLFVRQWFRYRVDTIALRRLFHVFVHPFCRYCLVRCLLQLQETHWADKDLTLSCPCLIICSVRCLTGNLDMVYNANST